ncbi:hypothetical protein ACQW5G_00720 [Fructilactobacillus sp. Tb1]|uniref:hypothetical protein n=1 Tax=Fructilactobacillus sp. Tb1 TaxID=3422304 RepID=UPI003D2E12F2
MNKMLLNVTIASTIALTGASVITINQPISYAKSSNSFSKEVQGKWTSDQGDVFTINNSNAKLKKVTGKHKGTYKFKIKSYKDNKYTLSPVGKKIAKAKKYTVSTSKSGLMQFNYGKQTIQFNNESLSIEESSKTVSNNNDNTGKQNKQTVASPNNSSNNQGNNANTQNTDTSDTSNDSYNNSPQVSAVRNSNPQEYAAEEARVENGTSCIANEPLLGEAQDLVQEANTPSN